MKPILNLNKHPKDCENLSLTFAENVRLSNDSSCLQSENSIIINETIRNFHANFYRENYTFIQLIPCNTELILISCKTSQLDSEVPISANIIRYNERTDECEVGYYGFNWYGGKIKGIFTYNVNNELILAIAEYDAKQDVPLRTINLGKYGESKTQLGNELLSINPEVIIPTLTYDYIQGNMPKGWYYIFVRYKIDDNDYTQWFDISGGILICDIEKQSIFKLYGYQYKDNEFVKFSSGILDHFSSQEEISNESIKIELSNLDNKYSYYQLAFICTNKSNTISYRSTDIASTSAEYSFNMKYMIEHDIVDILTDNYNFFNVKNLINYQNRLYIANYNESLLEDYNTSNIKLDMDYSYGNYKDVKKLVYSQTDDFNESYIVIDNEIDFNSDVDETDSVSGVVYQDLVYENVTYNTLIETENGYFFLNKATSDILTIKFIDDDNITKSEITRLSDSNGIGTLIQSNVKIITGNNKLLNIEFYAKVYYSELDTDKEIYFKYTIDNKSYYARGHIGGDGYSPSNNGGYLNFYIESTEITDNVLLGLDEDRPTRIANSLYINTKNSFNKRKKITTLLPGEVYNFYIHFVDKYGKSTKGFKINPKEDTQFDIFINSKGDKLFKVPFTRPDGIRTEYTFFYSYQNMSLEIDGVELPEGYIGYYISYEKYEPICKCTGFLTKFDFNDDSHLNNDDLNNHNRINTNKMYFFTSDFDIDESFDLKFNKIRIERKNVFKASENFDILRNAVVQNINNLNVLEDREYASTALKYYNIEDYDIQIGSDVIKNRFGLGTALELPIIDELFTEGEINLYKVSLLYDTDELYTNEDKTLIKCTNVIYPSLNPDNIIQYLNGRNTYNNFIIYDNNKFIYNTSNMQIYAEKNKEYIDYGDSLDDVNSTGKTAKPLVYIQMPVYKDYFYETKSFKNEPQKIAFGLSKEDENTSEIDIEIGLIVTPQNSIDLFENKYSHPDNFNPKTYQNNRTDITYLTEYNKFVRRSDVIKDESLSNSWRKFELENYKVISENKGNITNLIGIGTYLLVHTEHSIFLFNNDNVLKTEDRNVQLEMPDIFTMDYKELVTSELGYCGLQDNKAFVLGQFGYIFYDNDEQRIYRFDAGQINTIDDNIVQYLKKYKPTKIRFGHDKESNRILLSVDFKINDTTINQVLSYNYNVNQFISTHNYKFNNAVNTKNILYLWNDNDNRIHNFDYNNKDNLAYNSFSNGTDETVSSQLDIIINDNYNIIKQLEYIIYKLYKIKTNTNETYINSPVEEAHIPYSGERIRVYNNEVDTGWLNIKIDREEAKNVFSNYEKPNWDLGNWNFSYLRNKLSDKLGSDFMSRLYGNYFIVSIIFGDSNERVEFESLGYNITKDKRI